MINLLFSSARSPFSWLTRWGTRSQWSHVDIIMPNGREVVGALNWSGVTVQPIDKALANAARTGYAGVLGADEDAFFEFTCEQIGKPYDWNGIFGFGAARDWQDDSAWFCSELVAAALLHAGVTVAHESTGRITPRDLWVSPALTERRV